MLTETKRVENHDRVVELLNSVERDGISDLLKWLEESDFFTAPASRAYHGAYIGGLYPLFSFATTSEIARIFASF